MNGYLSIFPVIRCLFSSFLLAQVSFDEGLNWCENWRSSAVIETEDYFLIGVLSSDNVSASYWKYSVRNM